MAGVVAAAIAALVSVITLILNRVWHVADEKSKKSGEIISKIDDINSKIDAHIKTDDFRYIIQLRIRIQRFNDELLHGVKHTKEHFDQILRDITEYEKLCRQYPDIENNVTVSAATNIQRVYDDCLIHNSFL